MYLDLFNCHKYLIFDVSGWQSEEHPEHFVVNRLEIVSIGGSAEDSVALLVLNVFFRAYIMIVCRKITIIVRSIAVLLNSKIVIPSKYWSIPYSTIYQIIAISVDHFLSKVNLLLAY